jgi:uncharacterized damage-inducible protein DinB
MQVDPLRLFRYTYWADDLVLEGTRQLSPDRLTAPIRPGFLSTLGVLVHIMAAERVWLSRWKGDSPDRLLTVDDIPTLEALERAWTPQRAEMLAYLANVGDASQVIAYRTTKGDEMHDVLWQLILHLVNHHTEHRSQAALYLAMQGIDVGGLDFIRFIREGS